MKVNIDTNISEDQFIVFSHKLIPSKNNFKKLQIEFKSFLKNIFIDSDDMNKWNVIYSEIVSNNLKHNDKVNDNDYFIELSWWQDGKKVFLSIKENNRKIEELIGKSTFLPEDELSESGRGLFLIKQLSDSYEIWKNFNEYKQIISISHEDIKTQSKYVTSQDKLLIELENAFESLTAFRNISNELIQQANVTDFFNATIEHLNSLLYKEPDLLEIHLSDNNESIIREELSFINNIFSSEDKNSEKILNLSKDNKSFFWSNFDKKLDKTHLDKYHNGCYFPIVALDKFYGILVLAHKKSNHSFSASDENGIKTIADLFGIALAHFNINTKKNTEQRAMHELEIASQIQKSLIPISDAPKSDKWKITIKHQSAQKVGGDYLKAVVNDKGELIMTVADVMGKGISAAMVAAIYRTAFIQNTNNCDNLLEFVNRLNTNLCNQLRKLTIFITCSFIKIDSDLKKVHFVNAGHPPILRYSKNGKIQKSIEPSGPPIGLFKENNNYTSETFSLKQGDSFLTITDGLYEWNNGDGWWGWSNFLKYANSNVYKNPEKFWDNLVKKIHSKSYKADSYDDRAMLYWALK